MRSDRPEGMNEATVNGAPVDWDAIEAAQWSWAKCAAWQTARVACTCEPWAHWQEGILDGRPAYWVHLHHDGDCRFQRILQKEMN